MSQIADYAVLDDGLFTLPNNEDGINKDFSFNLPGDTVAVSGVLSYVVRSTSSNSAGLRYTVRLNGTQVVNDASLEDAQRRVVHEVVSGNDLREGSNTLVVERAGGSVAFQMSDVVLWFKRDI